MTIHEALTELENQESIEDYLVSLGYTMSYVSGSLCATCPVARFLRGRTMIPYEVGLHTVILEKENVCNLPEKIVSFLAWETQNMSRIS